MKLPAHKGKFAFLVIYVIVTLLLPFYGAATYEPAKVLGMIADFVPEKDDHFFRDYIALLRSQEVDEAYALLSPEAQQVVTKDALRDLAKNFSTLSVDMEVVGVNVSNVRDDSLRTIYEISYEVPNDDPERRFFNVTIGARDLGQGIKIDSVNSVYYAQSLKDQAKFGFPPFGWNAILAVLAPLLVAYTAYRYLTKAVKPSWWVLLMIILVSLHGSIKADGGFSINFAVNGFMGPVGLWGPWAYYPFVPLGAIIYYLIHRRFEGRERVADPVSYAGEDEKKGI